MDPVAELLRTISKLPAEVEERPVSAPTDVNAQKRKSASSAKFDLFDRMMSDHRLHSSEQVIGFHVVQHINRQKGYAWPSEETLARLSNKSVPTVRRAVRKLERFGYFDVRRPDHTSTNRYSSRLSVRYVETLADVDGEELVETRTTKHKMRSTVSRTSKAAAPKIKRASYEAQKRSTQIKKGSLAVPQRSPMIGRVGSPTSGKLQSLTPNLSGIEQGAPNSGPTFRRPRTTIGGEKKPRPINLGQ